MKTNFKTQPAIETPVGRVFAPNTISQKDGYYLSYNTRDWDTYGDATTAIVVETRREPTGRMLCLLHSKIL